MKRNREKQCSPEEQVLLEYLMAFLPADGDEENIMLKSSQDIQDDLSDMVEISINQITSVMRDTNYHIKVDADNRPKWMMLRKS